MKIDNKKDFWLVFISLLYIATTYYFRFSDFSVMILLTILYAGSMFGGLFVIGLWIKKKNIQDN